MDNVSNSMPENLAYDLRQRYAKIVGDHLEAVAEARQYKAYPSYFDALEDLYTVTAHKFKFDAKKGEEDKYPELRATCIKISNECSQSWLGELQDPEEVAKIEKALRDIERYLYQQIDSANMFGSKRSMEHLS